MEKKGNSKGGKRGADFGRGTAKIKEVEAAAMVEGQAPSATASASSTGNMIVDKTS
jgi:hypothetical protein